jgi:hypothetical protein
MSYLATTFALLIAISMSSNVVLPVPEGIHRAGKGTANVCGINAITVPELEQTVAQQKSAKVLPGTDEYRAYAFDQKVLTFTTEKNRAHPAVACRYLSKRPDGEIYVSTSISCFSSRENCDWLYREFEKLNKKMLESLERSQ